MRLKTQNFGRDTQTLQRMSHFPHQRIMSFSLKDLKRRRYTKTLLTPKERKENGGAALYVGLNWMIVCGKQDARTHFTDKGLQQLQDVFAKATSPHDMDMIFSHSQTWMQRDKKAGIIRFKMTPWYHDLEVQLLTWMLTMPNVRMEGQPAPRGPRMISLSEVIDKSNINRYGN